MDAELWIFVRKDWNTEPPYTPLLFISLSEFPCLVSVPAISVGVHGNLEHTANSCIVRDDTLKSKGRSQQEPTKPVLFGALGR